MNKTQAQYSARVHRNLNPTAPAIMAMCIFGKRYSEQRGGSMDFWDTLSEGEKRLCTEEAKKVQAARMVE